MSLKKLSEEMQSIICSSSSITNYKRTIEELVYNSLDAKATSIAIRVHIQENKVQVIDNGCGIAKKDFKLLGQRFATSKCFNLSQYKSATNTYGFRGQALSNIVEVSKVVKIISRFELSEETWSKTFYGGKNQNIATVAIRPSKGTTIDISGFLYNLNIRNKAINPTQELCDIKTFLQQISLVHCNVSLTLRDDRSNEIVFQMHKNRDIYQRLQNLFNIKKYDIQELKVEKNEYKSLAFIGKNCDEPNNHHWIYLNNYYLNNSTLRNIIHQYFIKYFKTKQYEIKKNKSKRSVDQHYNLTKNYVPFYIIFLTCPYYDYDISHSPKQTVLEFRDWKQIKLLLEKLVKFYVGDIKLKESKLQEQSNTMQQIKLREEVEKITAKILGNYSKKLGLSQMQNGIKGKLIKRKKIRPKIISVSKVLPTQALCNNLKKNCDRLILLKHVVNENAQKQAQNSKINIQRISKCENSVTLQNNAHTTAKCNTDHKHKADKVKLRKIHKNKKKKSKTINKAKKRTNFEKKTSEANNFESINSGNVIENIMHKNTLKQSVADDEKNDYRNVFNDNNIISISKRHGEITNNDLVPCQKKFKKSEIYTRRLHDHPLKSSHDLLKTILSSQQKDCKCYDTRRNKRIYMTCENNKDSPKLTYQSHKYENKYFNIDKNKFNRNVAVTEQLMTPDNFSPLSIPWSYNKQNKKPHFISKQSKDNFAISNTYKKTQKLRKNKYKTCRKTHYHLNNAKKSYYESSIFISESSKHNKASSYIVDNYGDFSDIEENNLIDTEENNEIDLVENNFMYSNSSTKIGFTYTFTSNAVKDLNKHLSVDDFIEDFSAELIKRNIGSSDENDNIKNLENSASFSKSQYFNSTKNFNIEPMTVCETILNNSDNFNYNHIRLQSSINNNSTNSLTPVVSSKNQNVLSQQDITYTIIKTSPSPQHNFLSLGNTVIESNLNYENMNKNYNQRSLQREQKLSGHLTKYTKNSEEVTNKIDHDNSEEVHVICRSEKVNDGIHDHDKITESNYFIEDTSENGQVNTNTSAFNLNNRFHFLPKGMSPIIKNCNSKKACDYNFDKNYFETTLYNNFKDIVHTHTEIYEATVQQAEDVSTKEIGKFTSRLERDNSTLKFSAQSLKQAKVLGQVDNKFIAAVMKGDADATNYLILFDQHAVHERIRLENNLSDYFNGTEWKSVSLDAFMLKMTKDEIMHLHNYAEKFRQFGLQWSILDDHEIKVLAIPFAVLGQHPREVDKVIKTVKHLISEEIINMLNQKGCVSLYPKSIMNLVNNEACRHAIMFGEALSKKECDNLLESLAVCKTPFQCAHGRPVMAVIMKFEPEPRKYQISLKNLISFRAKYKTK